MESPVCPDCQVAMELILHRDSGRRFWGCPNYPACTISVGAHQKDGSPMGTPACAEVREWRIKAHDEFDKLWKEGGLTRDEAYRWLTKAMKIKTGIAHIGEFDVTQCRKVIGLCKLTPPRGVKK